MADLGTTYIDLSNTEEIIQLEILSETPIEILPLSGDIQLVKINGVH